jgi:glycosyltransferase involved in cell wall biosynthesis
MSSAEAHREPSRVSVVVPTRDRLSLLRRAVASALAQEGVEVEVIVVDDGSTDGTRAWLETQREPRLRSAYTAPGGGVARARNAGLEAAVGEWVAFLDDDDFWAPTYLVRQVDAAHSAQAALCAASAVVVSPAGDVLQVLRSPAGRDLRIAVFGENVFGGPSRVLVRTDAARDAGGFDPALAVLADWDLWIRVLDRYAATVTADPLVAVTQHAGNMQVTHVDAIEDEIAIIRAKHEAAAAAMGREVGSPELYRWVASQYRRAGRRGRAARTYVAISRRYGIPRDLVRAAGVLAGERVVSITRPTREVDPVPDWLGPARQLELAA